MNLDEARQLMARPIPRDLAARVFGVDRGVLDPAFRDGIISLVQAFTFARRQVEPRLRAVRFAHRSAFMKARMAVQRAARALVAPSCLALAVAALGRAVVALIKDLENRLWPFVPRLADLASRAAKTILSVDHATTKRPKRRTGR